jgi:flagellar motility protein MotE (MotC chaperone)
MIWRNTWDWRSKDYPPNLGGELNMIRFLQSNWMSAAIGALIYLAVTVAVWRAPKIASPVNTPAVARAASLPPSWEFRSSELDELIVDLQHQKQVLGDRERQLNELESRLKAERQEIVVITQNVGRMQAEFDRNVVRLHDEEIANLKRLAKIYATMSPEGAVSIFKEMKDDDIVKIFTYMKDAETAPILELLAQGSPADAKRAAQISERLKVVLYRNTPNNPS